MDWKKRLNMCYDEKYDFLIINNKYISDILSIRSAYGSSVLEKAASR